LTRWASPKLAAYAALSATGLLAALVTGRPELVALTAPFLLALGLGLALAVPPRLTVALELDQERALEGGRVPARVVLHSETTVDRLDLYVRLPAGVTLAPGPDIVSSNPVSVGLRAGERRELELQLSTDRYGGHVLGPVYARARDPLGFLAWESAYATRPLLRVYPRTEVLRRVLRPRDTQVFAGNEVARPKSEGIEFADMRRFAPGDPLKRVNWRASARRDELWVNESHPERNTDVILFVDSFAEARIGGEGTLDLAVRATAARADAYGRRRDRVGLIGYGGILRWLVPGTGIVQLYRIVDALLDTEIILSYYWKEIDLIPRRVLPPNALVIALSPLLDPRSVAALLDLRARGFDLVVIDVSPIPYAPRPEPRLDALAFDIWTLRRDALRHRLQHAGVAVTEWRSDSSLQAHLEEVREFRRHGRLLRV
jgi:uncharacterized protein (DUF58 family)